MQLEPFFKPVTGKIFSTKNVVHRGKITEYKCYFLHKSGKFVQVQISERDRFGQSGKYLINGALGKDFFFTIEEARKNATEKYCSFIKRLHSTIKAFQKKEKMFEEGNENDFLEKV
jgi:hypothetical protein